MCIRDRFINQWIVCLEKDDIRDIEMLLFQLRKRIEKRIRDNTKNAIGECEFYFASLSSKTIVYKGMVRSEVLSEFYEDLNKEDFEIEKENAKLWRDYVNGYTNYPEKILFGAKNK